MKNIRKRFKRAGSEAKAGYITGGLLLAFAVFHMVYVTISEVGFIRDGLYLSSGEIVISFILQYGSGGLLYMTAAFILFFAASLYDKAKRKPRGKESGKE